MIDLFPLNAKAEEPGRSSARAAWFGVGAPIFGLVLIIIVMAIFTFAGFASEQDRGFERSSQRLVASAVEGRASSLVSVTLDYAHWEDAYENVANWNQTWVENNFYSSAADAMFVFRANGAVRYSWFAESAHPRGQQIQAAAVRAAVATPGLRRLSRSADVADAVPHTYVRVGDQLLIVSVAPLMHEDDAERLAQTPQNQDYLALVDIVTPAELAAMGASLDLNHLAFASAGDDMVSLDITANTGATVGAMTWRHEHPGAAAFQSRIWPVILCLLFVGGLTVQIARLVVVRQVSALAHARAALESSRAKSEFLTRVSHELRTPLNSIVGYAELIQEESVVEATRTDARSIVSAARQLGHLISDIIDQSKIDSGRMKFHFEPLPVAGVVAEVQGLMGHTAAAAGLAFTASSEPAAGFVYADHARLRQCLLNMLGNAVKFTPAGSVSLRATAGHNGMQPVVIFTVQDTGIGMTNAEIDEIFRPFGQANADISKSFGGAGLGLSIVRELARAMGGDIGVVSELGEGSTFTLTVPAATAQVLRAA